MKVLRVIIFVSITMLAHSAFAQLAGTKWVGTFNIPAETDCYFQFGKDTLNMIEVQSEALIEQMHYELKSDTLILKKISGMSPCDADAIGKYSCKIKDNTIRLTLISDDCNSRSGAGVDGAEMTKVIEAGKLKKD